MSRARVTCALVPALVCALIAGVAARGAAAPDSPTPPASKFPEIAILAYHDVAEDPGTNTLTVTPEDLRGQLRACREQGWTFVPLSELVAKREHPERLPPRSLVVVFDDGYRSFTEKALPILRAEGVRPALAVITSFVGTVRADVPPLLGWDDLRKLDASGDVELVSHSHALHGYEPFCPQGVTGPSVEARRWLAAAERYEDREQYRQRVGDDLARTQRAFREELGGPSKVLVWPYGAQNEMARGQAAHAEFAVTLTLEQRLVTAADLSSGCLPRYLVHREMRFARNPDWYRPPADPVRMATVSLDGFWNAGPELMRQRVDEALVRARAVGANQVMIPVFAAPQRDGRLRASFAMNHQALVAADVWAFAASRFQDAGFKVWAVVPTLNLTWAWDRQSAWRVPARTWPVAGSRWGTKLSPELPTTRRAAVDLVTDLAVYLPLDGIVFDDDATLAPHERLVTDGSRDPMAKAAAVRGLLEECKQAVRAWRPECRFARIAPQAVIERSGMSEEFAMSLEDSYARGELVITSMRAPLAGTSPYAAAAATQRLARRAADRWLRLGRGGEVPVVMLIPSREPRSGREVPSDVQVAMARALDRAGLSNGGSLATSLGGELPLGLLESRDQLPAIQPASKH